MAKTETALKIAFDSNPNGWTLQSFVNAVREGYKLIYKNRLKFGVWGHSIADLALEGFRRRGNKFFLFVGS
ncbi:MAG TPA: hypothetical protein VFA52_04265 [Candidatus Paceibacterota bacterium]|jgi:tetrahydromethanopterin S-methyltransferase subunit F|nr:hypothetical protein [Candidatus Paceibacterota bacterium]